MLTAGGADGLGDGSGAGDAVEAGEAGNAGDGDSAGPGSVAAGTTGELGAIGVELHAIRQAARVPVRASRGIRRNEPNLSLERERPACEAGEAGLVNGTGRTSRA